MGKPNFIYPSSVDGHLGSSHFLAIANDAVMFMYKFLCGYVFISPRWIPRMELLGHMVALSLTLRS